MNRRRFLRDAAQVGTGVGVGGVLLGKEVNGPAIPATSANQPAESDLSKPLGTSLLRLDGQWLIATDEKNTGRDKHWFAAPVSDARTTRVPSIIQEVYPGFHGVAWYWRDFRAPIHPYSQGRYLLHFERVDYLAEAWVNGLYVGGHEGGETPFVLDITDAVKPREKNWLAVRVLNPTNDPIDGVVLKETPHQCKNLPYVNGGTYDYGGIVGSVELVMVPAVRLENLYAGPDWKTGKIRIQATCRNTLHQRIQGLLHVSVAPASTGADSPANSPSPRPAAGRYND